MDRFSGSFGLVAALVAGLVGPGCAPAAVTAQPAAATDGGEPGDAARSGDGATADLSPGATDDGGVDGGDAGILGGPPPSALPVSYQRPDVGAPLSPAELSQATSELIALIKDTRYFDFVDERVHGWPETDPKGGFWYGTWWTGITLTKAAGKVTYKHSNDGTDNAGIHSSPYLEGACFAHLMWGEQKTAHLLRRLARGFQAWILAMVQKVGDPNPTLLARAFYPASVESTEGGRSLFIDYSLDRPGVDAGPSSYVHVPANPTFGDIYVKNKRSKDDVGHMLRAIAAVQACAPRLDADGQAELAQLLARYRSWGARVDAQGFVIETLDTSGNLWAPPDQLARYTLTGNLECLGALAVRLMGGAAPGTLDCGDGLPATESLTWSLLKNDARQILRTHHAAALALAYQAGQLTTALSLLGGLAKRVELDLGVAEGSSPPAGFSLEDVASELIFAANVGVPLTSHEIRWLHARLHQAYVGMRDPMWATTFDVFAPTTPDGAYSYDPPNVGLFHHDLGVLLGACASSWRNPSGRALLDCDQLRQAF